jgi:hypothetical protein
MIVIFKISLEYDENNQEKGSSDHLEHLVLSYLEAISAGGSRHRSVVY